MKQIGTHELHHAQADAIGDFGAACQRAGTQALDVMDHITQGETGISIRALMPKAQPVDAAIAASMKFWGTLFTPVLVIQDVASPQEEVTV